MLERALSLRARWPRTRHLRASAASAAQRGFGRGMFMPPAGATGSKLGFTTYAMWGLCFVVVGVCYALEQKDGPDKMSKLPPDVSRVLPSGAYLMRTLACITRRASSKLLLLISPPLLTAAVPRNTCQPTRSHLTCVHPVSSRRGRQRGAATHALRGILGVLDVGPAGGPLKCWKRDIGKGQELEPMPYAVQRHGIAHHRGHLIPVGDSWVPIVRRRAPEQCCIS